MADEQGARAAPTTTRTDSAASGDASGAGPGSASEPPAERAGLRPGDVVTAVAGQPVFTPEELMQAIQRRAGQTFELTVERDGKPIEIEVTLGERPTQPTASAPYC